jgi:hypothetical protein
VNERGTAHTNDGLWLPLWRALRWRRWRDWWLGPAGGLVVVALALAFRFPAGHRWVQMWGITHARDPWPLLLVRLPLSVFAPAQMLPFAFAVLQVTVVFGAAQILLGWRTALVVGLVGHSLATMSARGWIWLGPPVGLPHRYLDFPDAGPSVAVVALAAYLAMERRLVWLAAILVTYHVAEMVLIHGLSQREHLVGVLVGASALPLRGAAIRWWRAHERVMAPVALWASGPLAPAVVPQEGVRRLDR